MCMIVPLDTFTVRPNECYNIRVTTVWCRCMFHGPIESGWRADLAAPLWYLLWGNAIQNAWASGTNAISGFIQVGQV